LRSIFLRDVAYQAKGDYDGVIGLVKDAISSNLLSSRHWIQLGQIYRAKGDHHAALATYHSALQFLSHDPLLHKLIGDTHLEILEYDLAEKSYNRALAKGSKGWHSMISACLYLPPPDFVPWIYPEIDHRLSESFVWHSLGQALSGKREHTAATKVYEDAIGTYRAAAAGKYMRLFWHHIDIDYGRLDVFQTKELLPKAMLWAILGEAYKAKGDLTEARESFVKAQQLQTENKWLQSVIDGLKERITNLDSERVEIDPLDGAVDTAELNSILPESPIKDVVPIIAT
jgi:tetratricopeptide (TPR) repeat protein